MFCEKCGSKLKENDKYCINCGARVIDSSNQNISSEDNKKANKLSLLALLFLYAPFALFETVDSGGIIYALISILPLAGIVLLISTRIKYPKNTLSKVLMWYLIIYILFSIVSWYTIIKPCTEEIERTVQDGCG